MSVEERGLYPVVIGPEEPRRGVLFSLPGGRIQTLGADRPMYSDCTGTDGTGREGTYPTASAGGENRWERPAGRHRSDAEFDAALRELARRIKPVERSERI